MEKRLEKTHIDRQLWVYIITKESFFFFLTGSCAAWVPEDDGVGGVIFSSGVRYSAAATRRISLSPRDILIVNQDFVVDRGRRFVSQHITVSKYR